MSSKHVVIVGSDPSQAQEWAGGLERFAFDVTVATSAEDTLSAIEKRAPDLLVLGPEADPRNKKSLWNAIERSVAKTPAVIIAPNGKTGDSAPTHSLQHVLHGAVGLDVLLDEIDDLIGLPIPIPATAPLSSATSNGEGATSAAELVGARRELADARRELGDTRSQLQAAEHAAKRAQEETRRKETANEQLRGRIGALETTLAELQKVQSLIIEVEERAQEKVTEAADAAEQIAELQIRVKSVAEQRTRLEHEYADREEQLLAKVSSLDAALRSAELARVDLAKQLKNSEKSLADERALAAQERAKNDKRLEALSEKLKDAKNSAHEQQQAHAAERAALEGRHAEEVKTIRAHYEPLVEEGRNTARAAKALQEKIADLETRMETARAEHERATHEHRTALSEVQKGAASREAELLSKVAESETEIEKMRQRVVKAYKRIKGDERQIEQTKKALEMAMTVLNSQSAAPPKSDD